MFLEASRFKATYVLIILIITVIIIIMELSATCE